MSSFKADLAWTYIALIVMGASGFLMNFAVGLAFGPTGLGVFNQALAVFVVVAQLSAFGFHWATFKSVAEHAAEPGTVAAIVSSGLVMSVGSGLGYVAILLLLADPIGAVFNSPETALALKRLAPALLLLNVNKLLLSAINALQRMRFHATAQIVRYLTLLLVVAITAATGSSAADVAWCFLVSEVVLAILLAFYAHNLLPLGLTRVDRRWMDVLFPFGLKSMWSGVAIELNVRTDILLIGIFLDDAAVGAYALASVIFEGMLNLFQAVRINVNPLLVRTIKSGDWTSLRQFVGRSARWLYPATALAWALAAALYLPVTDMLLRDQGFAMGYVPMLILMTSLLLTAGLLPFDQILLQGGHAGRFSLTQLASFVVNVVLNLALVPQFGLIGAAAATATALVCGLALALLWARRLHRAAGPSAR